MENITYFYQMKFLKKIGFVYAFFCVLTWVNAQEGLLFHHLTRKDGLLHDNVTCISQDSLGYMWFGTHRGLNRYDGYTIDSYKNGKGKVESVYYNRIYSMQSMGHYLWLATAAGLTCFDIQSKKFIEYEQRENSSKTSFYDQVRIVKKGFNNQLWLISDREIRVIHIVLPSSSNKNEKPVIEPILIQSQYQITCEVLHPKIATDNQQNVWITENSNLRLYHFKNGKYTLVPSEINFIGSGVRDMYYENGFLWILYHNQLKKYQVNKQKATYTLVDEFTFETQDGLTSLSIDNQSVWITSNRGLFQVNKQQKTIFAHRHDPTNPYSISNDVNNNFLDNQGNIWVSAWASGISYADTKLPFFHTIRYTFSDKNSVKGSEFISAMHYSDDGYIYIGSKFSGISRLDTRTKSFEQNYCNSPELLPSITSLHSDAKYLYAAVREQITIIRKADKRVEHILPTKGYVFGVDMDKYHRLWVATHEGLQCFEQKNGTWQPLYSFTQYSDEPYRLSTNILHNIYSDTTKNELLITSTKGIHRVILSDSGEVSRIVIYVARENDSTSLSSNYLWPIRKGGEHTYWVGTLGSGLNKVTFLDKNGAYTYTSECYGTESGALSGDVESIEVDAFGKVWCGGYNLSYFDDSAKRYRVFDTKSGLQSHIFGTSSSCRDAQGNLYFGGAHGLNYFLPLVEEKQEITPIYFSRYRSNQIYQNDIEFSNKIVLEYPNNTFSVDFTILSYNKEPIRYRYKLSETDTKWQYIEGKPTITYQRVPFGKHKLLVEAGNWDRWSGNVYSLEVVSYPPIWLSWGAYVLYCCLGIGLVYIGFRYFIRWTQMKQLLAIQNEREQQKEEMMQLKMQFFTDVSHEFRTPLTMIGHAVTEIDEEPNQSKKYINIIRRNAGKLSNMVNELLDFHKMELRQPTLKTSYINVSSFITDIYDEFKEWSSSQNIQMSLTIDTSPINMWIDQRYFGKIISNILSNSIRYSKEGNLIHIQVSQGTLKSISTRYKNSFWNTQSMINAPQLIIKVSDMGIGIDKEVLPKIFDRFYRGNKQRTRLGSGIGLSLVKSLMELHRGGIIISSEMNVGTEIILMFPITDTYLISSEKIDKSDFVLKEYLSDYAVEYEPHTEEECIESQQATDKPTLLLVDDNHEVLMILREIFVKEYAILMASDGQEALEKCNTYFPDLIISDVMMPKMDGLELCEILKKQLRTCFIPIILLTAKAQIEHQIEGIETGADAYLLKPFNTKLLKATVRNLLRKNGKNKDTLTRKEHIDKKQQAYLQRIETLVLDNLTNHKFSVDHLSMELGWSRTKLYANVKNATGITLAHYIRKIRLDKAAELLTTTDMRISEVCYQVGIDSPAYFTRAFREEFGVSPSEYIHK